MRKHLKYRAAFVVGALNAAALTCAFSADVIPSAQNSSMVSVSQSDSTSTSQQLSILKQQNAELQSRLEYYRSIAASYAIDPLNITPLTEQVSGFNSSNPSWSSQNLIGYDRNDQQNREIVIVDSTGDEKHTISYQSGGDELGIELLLPGITNQTYYNTGLSWSPEGDRFVYMSNGSEGNYDIYLGSIDSSLSERLTNDPEKDGHPAWSPVSDTIAFVSGRTGNAELFLFDIATRQITQLTKDKLSSLYPAWSPDGNNIAYIYGSNQNHDIRIVQNALTKKPIVTGISDWKYDDLRPIWSPDGKKLAWYTNYNLENDPKQWSLVVVDVKPFVNSEQHNLAEFIIATDVIPDIEKGPAWLPDSAHIAYVKNDRQRFNPIFVTNVQSHEERMILTNTRINHDIDISREGVLAFRSQIDQWDHIFVVRLPKI